MVEVIIALIALIGLSCGLTAGLVMSLKKDIKRLSEEVDDLNERVCALEWGTREKDKQVLVPFSQPVADFPCDGIHCDNPFGDCINCPRKAGYGWNSLGNVTITTTNTDNNEERP